MNSTISLLILAKNEEKNIGECIKSCTFANEVIVIDDHSNDETPIIAESLGAKVITRDMNGDWGETTNVCDRAGKIRLDFLY